MKLRESISDFLTDQRSRGNSPATLDYYRRILFRFADFANVTDTAAISLHHCRAWYAELADSQLTSVSVQTYIRGLRAFLEWLYENEYIPEDIPRKFKLPKAQRKTIDILTDDEIRRLFAAFDPATPTGARDLCICSLMLDSGLRLHEVVTLRRDSIHPEDGYAIVSGKGSKQRIVPIGKQTAEAIRRYEFLRPRGGSSFFLCIDGAPVTDNTLKDLFRKLKHRAEIPRLHPHLLRHTFATRYLENGGNIYSLQTILGHTSLEMVKRYLHLANTRIRRDFSKYSPLDNLFPMCV